MMPEFMRRMKLASGLFIAALHWPTAKGLWIRSDYLISVCVGRGVMMLASMLAMSLFYNWLDVRAAPWGMLASLYKTEKELEALRKCVMT
jgi:hypothetical protein